MKLISLLQEWINEKKGDRNLNIKTMGRDDSVSDDDHNPYEPTPYSVLERLADSGYINGENTLVDYGCGKGRVALFFSHRIGCRAIGIEYDEDFFQEAEENGKRILSGMQTVFLLQNAERWQVPAEADRFYFFNPFSLETLQKVMNRIAESYRAAPRRMLLFFYYPSEMYMLHFKSADNLLPVADIDCRDLFPDDDDRERVLVYEWRAGEKDYI